MLAKRLAELPKQSGADPVVVSLAAFSVFGAFSVFLRDPCGQASTSQQMLRRVRRLDGTISVYEAYDVV